MMLEWPARGILGNETPMQFLKFGSIFPRKKGKGGIRAVFEGGVW
jgi:hypothetical protein